MSFVVAAALAIGALIVGVGAGYWFARAGNALNSAKLSEVEDEFEAYRGQVTEHFAQTANHFQSLGQQYRELYDHMAAGSQTLCRSGEAASSLPFVAADPAAVGFEESDSVTTDGEAEEVAATADDGEEASAEPESDTAAEAEATAEPEATAESEASAEPAAAAEGGDDAPKAEGPSGDNGDGDHTDEMVALEDADDAAPATIAEGEAERAERTLH